MRRTLLITYAFMCIGYMIKAQSQTWILQNGEIINSTYTTFTIPKKGVPYFTFDKNRVEELSKIKYIRDDSNKFRVQGLYKRNVIYLPRIVDGPSIDIYKREYKKNSLSNFNFGRKNSVDYYFEKNEQELKTLNFKNLKLAVSEHPGSQSKLRKATFLRWIEFGSLAISAATAYGVIQADVSDFRLDLAAISILSLVPVAIIQKPKTEIYFETIEAYNKQ